MRPLRYKKLSKIGFPFTSSETLSFSEQFLRSSMSALMALPYFFLFRTSDHEPISSWCIQEFQDVCFP